MVELLSAPEFKACYSQPLLAWWSVIGWRLLLCVSCWEVLYISCQSDSMFIAQVLLGGARSEMITGQDFCGSFYFAVNLPPGAAVGKGSSDVGADGQIFVPLRTFTSPVEAMAGVSKLDVHMCVETFAVLFD
ncbi:hypothetical protein E2C01_066542 [Portunus trituberculatus]|uniref:Uncharacterized protein n=1 Tax=Portunus trituberculatus TaxID=210409 RepID=A0A5B7HUY7_PORTR|nr:hypothetical protein [Portunus trituberculatus]